MDRTHPVELITPDGMVRLEVGEEEAILDAAFRAGLDLPHMCLQGWCLSCAGRTMEGRADHSTAFRYYAEDQAAGFILLCSPYPRSPLRIQTHQKGAMQKHRTEQGLPTPRG